MAVRVYGIPRVIEAREIFHYNGGQGKLHITFTGGILDPKYSIPATYTTDSEFEQLIIENSSLFGTKVFRYGPKGEIISSVPTAEVAKGAASTNGRNLKVSANDIKTYEDVSTIGEATEILMDLGAKASELKGQEAVLAAMIKYKVSFPNLKSDE